MKIGIISINAHTKVLNFASPLHSYAFQQFLKMHGYDSVIIDYKPNYYGQYNPRHPLFYQLSHPMKNKKKQRAALKKWLKLFIPRQIRFDEDRQGTGTAAAHRKSWFRHRPLPSTQNVLQ